MIVATALMCLSLNIYHESRGEPVPGRYAVAQVTMNRAEGQDSRVCDEVFKKYQFSWANEGVKKVKGGWFVPKHLQPSEESAWDSSKRIASTALQGRMWDFSKSAKFYHTLKVKPGWAKKMQVVARIGNHIFYVHKA